MSVQVSDPTAFLAEIDRISQEVAAANAVDVDANARFPVEAVDALREAGALSAFIPESMGGAGHDIAVIAAACQSLARGCSATGMVYAMHQLQIANVFRHVDPDSWHGDYLRRVSADQRLVASVTSEMGTGGDMARSIAAVTSNDDGSFSFEKQAPTVSYGQYGDDLLTTVRRGPDAPESDQVVVVHSAEQTELMPAGAWDTLGMRGTCSPGFTVKATFPGEQILDQPFSTMMSATIVPVSHILWSHVWLGIGTEAFERGRKFVRAAARRAPGEPVSSARKMSETLLELRLLRAEVASAVDDFITWDASEDRAELATFTAGLRFNGLKLVVSERVPGICTSVLGAVGIMAYKNDSPFSVGRMLRDSLSGQLMITNERIHSTNAGLLAIAKEV